jgi:hypothetical protein
MPTIARTLELAQVAGYLSANYKTKGALFGGYGQPSSKNQSQLIYMVYTILNKVYTENPTQEGLQAVSDYLYELLQKFAFKAANIVDGGGGGQITPITPTLKPDRIEFEVDGTTFIATGETTVQLPISWDGWNVELERGNIPQSTLNTQPSYFTYDEDTRELTISPAAFLGELIAIIPSV